MEFTNKGTVAKSSSTRPMVKKPFDHPDATKASSKYSSTKPSRKNRVPPPAPMPPRLPTPDLSDLECGDFCECCGNSNDSAISAMDKQLAAAKRYIAESRSRVVSRPEYERKNGRALRLEAGNEKKVR